MSSLRARKPTGSIIAISVLTICFVILPVVIVSNQIGLYMVDRARIQSVIEAAGLLAANDLSRVCINDPNFGYVSLSNYPPIGKATFAGDQEPLPVIGINTLVGTVRLNALIANALDNQTMRSLVQTDHANLEITTSNLNSALRGAVSTTPKKYRDIKGEPIDIMRDTYVFLAKNLPENVELESVGVTSGWLGHEGTTTIEVPKPQGLAEVNAGDCLRGQYSPFVNLPVGHLSFKFAGVGAASALVPTSDFRPADKEHVSSIIKLECTVMVKHRQFAFGIFNNSSGLRLNFVACCQPYCLPDQGPPGVLTLRFSDNQGTGLRCWLDCLNPANFGNCKVATYAIVGGDYPTDHDARMNQVDLDQNPNTAQEFAESLYLWLRNGHTHPHLDSVMQMAAAPFNCRAGSTFVYEFAKNGEISRRALAANPFPVGITSDQQVSNVADTTIRGGAPQIVIFRKNVKNLGVISGGKHAGQALAGVPLNWCELPEYGGNEILMSGLSKGHEGTRLTFIEEPVAFVRDPYTSIGAGTFLTESGKPLVPQPRRSYYSGGLAVDIELSSAPVSTAQLDIARMAALRR